MKPTVPGFRPLLGMLCLALLNACGGGGGGGASGQALGSLTLTGTAATGAAIDGGPVLARCKSGSGSATTQPDGSFTLEVSEGALPCILKATDPISRLELHSVLEDGALRSTNITPATELVTAHLLGSTPAAVFADFSGAAQSKISPQGLVKSVDTVRAATAAIGADMNDFDIMKGRFAPATELSGGDANDKKIDALMAALGAADKRLRDLSAVLSQAQTGEAAASGLTTLVGESRHSLPNCPQARSGPVWVFAILGGPPLAYAADFQKMRLTKQSTGDSFAISPVQDSSSRPVPCAFTSDIGGVRYEYRISQGGLIMAQTATGGALVLPAQRSHQLTDTSFAGAYPALAFIKSKTSSLRLAVPVRFELDPTGKMSAYACDLSKPVPDCLTEVAPSDKDDIQCTNNADGTFSCFSASSGFQGTAALYLTGSQATLVFSIANMNIGNGSYQGMIVMTKAGRMALPTLGHNSPAGSTWNLTLSDSVARSSDSLASTVTAVNTQAQSFTSRIQVPGSSPVTSEAFLNKPAQGFVYSESSSSKSIQLRSAAGWALSASKRPEDSYYANWTASIRMNR